MKYLGPYDTFKKVSAKKYKRLNCSKEFWLGKDGLIYDSFMDLGIKVNDQGTFEFKGLLYSRNVAI